MAGGFEGSMATHHVDEMGVVQTTWVDGWPEGTTDYDKGKWEGLSAGLNAVMIVVFGIIYEKIAVSMTDW